MFLESNVQEGRQRWRCAVCENFIAVEDLVYCKLTRDLLEEFKASASSSRDRVEFRLDGTYELLPERPLSKRSHRRVAIQQMGKSSDRKGTPFMEVNGGSAIERRTEQEPSASLLDQEVIVL